MAEPATSTGNLVPSGSELAKNQADTETQTAKTDEQVAEEKNEKDPQDQVSQNLETNQNPNPSEEGEEEEECGFCLFMKSGGCREQFMAWEKCVEEGEANKEDIVAKCYKATSLLKECMDRHSDYYEPVLRAEAAMEEHVAEEMKEQGQTQADEGKSESPSEGTATIEVPNSEEKQE